MGSVQDHGCECPNCKQGNMFEDYYYKTGEVYQQCPDCGYYFSVFFKRDKKGNYVKKDKSLEATYDNLIPVKKEIKKPYCAYHITTQTDGGIGGSIKNKKEYDLFLENIKNKSCKVEISRFLNKKIVKCTL
jgi:hypothetical protein